MKCKRVLSGAVLTAICVSMTGALSGCGEKEVTVYKTEHDSGEWEISSLDELLFEKRTSAVEIAEIIPDFCMYEGYEHYYNDEVFEEDYTARVPVSIDGNDSDFIIHLRFNADKEFVEWRNNDGLAQVSSMSELTDSDSAFHKSWQNWYNVLEDRFGEPDDDSDGECRWEIDEKRIFLSTQIIEEEYYYWVRPNVLYRP